MPAPEVTARGIWLMYHDVYSGAVEPDVPRTAALYHVSRAAFREHLAAVRESGLPVLTASEALAATRDHVVITLDDGWAGSLSHGVECLLDEGMRGTFFVTRDYVGKKSFADRDLLVAASRVGMEIGSHGTTHRLLAQEPEAVAEDELRSSRAFLEDTLGVAVRSASTPGGDWSPLVGRLARDAGYACLGTSWPGINRPGDDPFSLRRVAVRGRTDRVTVERWLRFSTTYEQVRQGALGIPRRVLGADRYARFRRRLLR